MVVVGDKSANQVPISTSMFKRMQLDRGLIEHPYLQPYRYIWTELEPCGNGPQLFVRAKTLQNQATVFHT
jgi:hypothetical protein